MASIATTTQPSTNSTSGNGQTYRGPFAIMTVLFFMWGFMTVFNDILIPRFKDAFTLDYYHAMFVQLAFFGAYFVGSVAYFIISATTGDPIAKIGYKNGVIIGLLIAATGSALFWPAATLAPQSLVIAPSDFSNLPSLVAKLNQQKDPVSAWVYGNLSASTHQALAQGSSSDPQAMAGPLAQDLNQLITHSTIYDPARFAGVTLLDTTKTLAAKNPQGEALVRLNRSLLEDAYPAEIRKNLTSYWFFLTGLFIVGMGFAMLQIAANPYVTILGPERTASTRLNLAQAFNSVGTTIGPLIGGYLIFQYFAKTGAQGAESVKIPYLIFCIMFVALAGIFAVIHLPHVGEGKAEKGIGALRYPHVLLGVLAIFMYVGGEVSIGSSIINYLGQPSVAGLTAVQASKYVALFWGGMLIGRFMASVGLSEMPVAKKQILLLVIPVAAYFLFPLVGIPTAPKYLPMLALCWLLFQFGRGLAGRTLLIFSATIVALLLVAMVKGGPLAMWCIVGIGLFTSIGWPNIFSLALDGMGVYKSQVSSLLVMAVLGGALLPPLQGKIADQFNLQISFIVPLIAYAYVGFYGCVGHKIGRSRQVAAV